MTTFDIILLVILIVGIVFIVAGILLSNKDKHPAKRNCPLLIVGAAFCALALLPLPYLASTNQLAVLVATLGTN